MKRLLGLLVLLPALASGADPGGAPPQAVLRAPGDADPLITVDSDLWKRQSSWDGIVLYEADLQRGGIVPVKAEMELPGSIEEISVVLDDISRRGEWLVNYGESILLTRESDYHQTEYLRMNMPWPVTDRTALVGVDIRVSPDRRTAVLSAASVDCCQPAGKPVGVRARVYASTFQMTQAGPRVKVVGLVFIDPQGGIPKWAVNLYTRHVARETLQNLRRQVQRKLYGPELVAAMAKRIQGYAAWKSSQSKTE